ncbi:MAG: SAM-dependent DNA methyltransferase [Herminiimonas sp.]|nr:SAM-dependent DNA methyltransferase [Herminiimonas sp.]
MSLAASASLYTPAAFARFLALKMVTAATLPATGEIRILDPAVGDGVLLDALVRSLPEDLWPRVQVFGFDANAEAIRIAASRLHRAYPAVGIHLQQEDFLSHMIAMGGADNLFAGLDPDSAFHFIIANPPHVRMQIMGDEEAQRLAEHFGLTGSVDLYYPFLLGIAEVLAEDGVAGVITANSDLTEVSGRSVREALLTRFRIQQVWDLGDTSLFDAAVVPSVLVAKGRHRQVTAQSLVPAIRYGTIRRTDAVAQVQADDVLSAFDADDDTVVSIADGRRFRVRHGAVDNGGDVQAGWHLQTGADNDRR